MSKTIRVAAAGDIHAGAADGDRVREAFERVEAAGRPRAARGRPDAARPGRRGVRRRGRVPRRSQVPVVAVLGNHDWQSDRPADLVARSPRRASSCSSARTRSCPCSGVSVGVAGVKGFVGGFGQQWANFGEPLFREAYAETTRDVDGLERGLARDRPVRDPHRAPALLAGRGDARRRAGALVARARRRPARGPDPRAPAAPRRARARAPRLVRGRRSTACRSTTSPCT